MTIESLLSIMQSKYKHGESLYSIFEQTKAGYERGTAQAIFHAFIRKNQKDTKFMNDMNEFNSTVFNLE